MTKEDFITRAIAVHGNKYDYSKVVYSDCKTPVDIICPEHGVFRQRPSDHYRGCGCPKCAHNDHMTKDDFIKRAIDVHGNKYDYSKVEYINARTKVCIICPEHGEFWQRPNDHLNGNGCPKCAHEECSKRKLMTKDDFITHAIDVHGNKYDYSKVEYINSATKVCIICPEHGEFRQRPNSHLSGKGCPKCGIVTRSSKRKCSNDDFITRAIAVHGNKYAYSKVVYSNNKMPVDIICPEHGVFRQSPKSHLSGKGCPKCAHNDHMTKDEFITRAIAVHGDKYDYSKVEYINAKTKICIICPQHGEFWQRPSEHLSGNGCPKCGIVKRSSKITGTKDDFIKRAIAVHGNKYDYSNVVYSDCRTPVDIICPEHGVFRQSPYQHYRGHGCPKCVHDRSLKYTKEVCFNLSKQCSSRSEFAKLNGRAYKVSRINGWLDEMTHFGTPKRHKVIEWIKNNIVYVYEFPNKVVYIGRTNNLKNRHKQHKKIHKHSNGKISMSQVLKYSQDNLLPIPEPRVLKDNLTLSESRLWEDNMCKKYRQDGYRLLNIAKTGPNTGSIGAALLYDNYDEILEKAKTCKSHSEFQKKFSGMCSAAKRMNIFEKIAEECKWKKRVKWTYQTLSEIVKKYPHQSELKKYERGAYNTLRRMGLLYEFYPRPSRQNDKPNGYWNIFKNVEKEAKKYKSRGDFWKNNQSAYGAARRNNWLDKLFPMNVEIK